MGLEREMLIKTADEVLGELGPYFREAVESYLRTKYSSGLELVGEDPEKFYSALETLLGEFAANVFFSKLLAALGVSVEYPLTGKAVIDAIKTYLGST